MIDRTRVLCKLDEMDGYLKEIHEILPRSFKSYRAVPIKRSTERLLQLGVECMIDICQMLVSGLRLGLPADEVDLFQKLLKHKIISVKVSALLGKMRGFRNVLVHDYAEIDDEIVFQTASKHLEDFQIFKNEILKYLRRKPSPSVIP